MHSFFWVIGSNIKLLSNKYLRNGVTHSHLQTVTGSKAHSTRPVSRADYLLPLFIYVTPTQMSELSATRVCKPSNFMYEIGFVYFLYAKFIKIELDRIKDSME